jgi:aspartyl-tRNA(Asn)/glutamyl-tRNA(Gln) amidotransferase subunit C
MKYLDIQKLFKITHIELHGDSLSKISESVVDIIRWGEILNKANVEGVEPMFALSDITGAYLQNMREDEVIVNNTVNEVLFNVPDKDDVFICVPKVIE